MPMRLPTSFRWQMVLAVVGGLTLSAVLSFIGDRNAALAEAGAQLCRLAGFIALTWTRALAVPLIFSSLVLGAVGLEPMRALGRLSAKTVAWMVGSSILAVLVACLVGGCVAPSSIHPELIAKLLGEWADKLGNGKPFSPQKTEWTWGWLGLVLAGLGCAYYGNQLEEGHAKLFRRFCHVLEGIVTPLLRVTRSFVAVTVFFVLASHSPAYPVGGFSMRHEAAMELVHFLLRGCLLILGGGTAYLLTLSAATRLLFRVNVWRVFRSLIPAMWLAAAGNSVEAALPLTFGAVRGEIGVSNRVASVTLSLCATLHRDGLALGWMAAVLYLSRCLPTGPAWPTAIGCGLLAVVVGCGSGALAGQGLWLLALFAGVNGWEPGTMLYLVLLGAGAMAPGAAVSVFSHACAAVVIARSEGEYWVPGPPPSSDEVQRLKADLQAADE